MSARFVNMDRCTPMLLPPDLRDWIPADHPARVLVDLMEHLDYSAAAINHRRSGSEQYPPAMMLALLLYSYSQGVFSSRRIEQATYTDVAVRFITADHHPDHDTICTFRRRNRELIKDTFAQSRRLAGAVGILQIGAIKAAMDGTKMAGNLSSQQTLTHAQINELLQRHQTQEQELQGTIDQLIVQAEQIDRDEQNHAPTSPEELSDPAQRSEKLAHARQQLTRVRQRQERLAAAQSALKEQKQQDAEEREQLRRKVKDHPVGHIPDAKSAEVQDRDRVNVTDPDSVSLKGQHGYLRGYNAQLSVDLQASGLILGAHLSRAANNRHKHAAIVAEQEANLGPGAVALNVGDRGYDNIYWVDTIVAGPPKNVRSTTNDSAARKTALIDGGGEKRSSQPLGSSRNK